MLEVKAKDLGAMRRDSAAGEAASYGILPARSQDIHRIRTVTPVEGANLQQYERRSQVSQREAGSR